MQIAFSGRRGSGKSTVCAILRDVYGYEIYSTGTVQRKVAEEMGIKVNIEGFLRFADWFFDGIFVDYSVLQRIEESKEKICEIKQRLKAVKKHLQNKLNAVSVDSERTEAELEKLVLEAEV